MKRIIHMCLLVCCLLVPFGSPALASPPGQTIHWLSFDEAKKIETHDQSKKFLLYFYTSWCHFCHKLDQETFGDRAVAAYINSHFIPVRINSEELPDIAAHYAVRGVPDLYFLSSTGEKIARWPGYIDPDKLLPLLKYIQSDSYLKMGYNEFLKSH
jgi:thioredoxin-related protein